MINIKELRALEKIKVIVFGNHEGIIQSILDFDFLVGKKSPSIIGVVGVTKKRLRYFWGDTEVLIQGFLSLKEVDAKTKNSTNLFVVAQSGRRVESVSETALDELPEVLGGMIFAENVPEKHALRLRQIAEAKGKFIIGPASVGMTIGGIFKIGAIGGTLPEQIINGHIILSGNTAVISTSGGMINELITMVANSGSGISFAVAVGGERYPITKPVELIKQALEDINTKAIVYFGELGGSDEYDIAELLKKTKQQKPFMAYIAGTIADNFETAPQFGHAKAFAQNKSETALAKRAALKEAGAQVANNFAEFETLIKGLPKVSKVVNHKDSTDALVQSLKQRKPALFVNSVSSDKGGEVKIMGTPLVNFVSSRSLSKIALSMFLGSEPKSQIFTDFFDTSLRLLVDHGPQVSGAVNTMITARAGKDITAALASGILTVGPRFGGAIGEAAKNWFDAVDNNETPQDYVERFAQSKQYIPGIGHKKYRVDNPDPRVALLLKSFDNDGKYISFAKRVALATTQKKAQLILNVDGAIAALLLDILTEQEHYSNQQIMDLLATDFCNAIFIYARSVGFIAHFLEQQRLDEGLFRLPDDQISSLSTN